jgi:hypothetical protein
MHSLEFTSCIEAERCPEIQIPYELVRRHWTVLALDLGENQPGGIAIVKPPEVDLILE